MPVWNRADIIKAAIESVLAQSFSDFELLIIDDGSNDDLYNAVEPYLSDRVIYHHREHQGVCAARNFGLEQAQGNYIAYLDSDNIWHADFLEIMHQALSNSKTQIEAAYCCCHRFEKDAINGQMVKTSVVGGAFDIKRLVERNYIDLNTFVHTKQCVLGGIAFDENLKRLNDWDFILQVTSRHKPVFVNQALVDYHHDLVENTITQTENFIEPFITIKQRFKQFDDRNITIVHDAICYEFKNVDEKKYYNYLKMSHRHELDTENFTTRGFPYMIQVEPTNMCNLSCAVCPAAAGKSDLKRDRRHMTLDEFKGIVDDMEDYLLLLVLWDWGEPFMNPAFPDMLKYASDKGIQTVTSTNAHFLNDEAYLSRILTSGLTTLIIAIDSLQDANYEIYRKGGNLSKAMAGMTRVLSLKKKLASKTLINLRMVIMKSNENELADMRQLAKKLRVDRFTVKTANPTRGVDFKDDKIIPDNLRYRRYAYKPGTYDRIRMDVNCTKCWFLINIHTNGNVVACNYDYDQEMVIGNVYQQPLTQLWNGEDMRALRKKLYYDKDVIHKCRECDVNFQLNDWGWFVEMHEFNVELKTRIIGGVKRVVKKILPQSALERIRQYRR